MIFLGVLGAFLVYGGASMVLNTIGGDFAVLGVGFGVLMLAAGVDLLRRAYRNLTR